VKSVTGEAWLYLTFGGYGSGMWRVSRRPLAETMRRIDLAALRRDEPPLTARDVLQVKCQRNNGEEVEVANVCLESTRVYFGGWRLWFRCPRCDGAKSVTSCPSATSSSVNH